MTKNKNSLKIIIIGVGSAGENIISCISKKNIKEIELIVIDAKFF